MVYSKRMRKLHDERYEDARWMLDNDETYERCALRLGMTVDGLIKMLHRYEQQSA